ncbi:segregation and condensation protein A [candidate division CSSED10-310 bacterium]|uniref:Segregation and condensation protein A n=1 Tax=candidate division CSSED10-310 bacterium TaxID=2855610 RepID=A0ABV6YS13_UNCC1
MEEYYAVISRSGHWGKHRQYYGPYKGRESLPPEIVAGVMLKVPLPGDLWPWGKSITMAFKVALDIYEGPLELLLHLIKRQRLVITEVSLVKITHQFLETIDIMKEIDLDVAADFLRIAALLIDLKARELLPPVKPEQEEEMDEIQNLLLQLEELQKYKQIALLLHQKEDQQSKVWFHEEHNVEFEEIIEFKPSLYDLLKALKNVLTHVEEDEHLPPIRAEKYSVLERMNELLEHLAEKPILKFIDLFEKDKTKLKIILTFLALLELIRLNLVLCFQNEAFTPIVIHKNFQGVTPKLSGADQEYLLIDTERTNTRP